jgi:hypothetical protein
MYFTDIKLHFIAGSQDVIKQGSERLMLRPWASKSHRTKMQ